MIRWTFLIHDKLTKMDTDADKLNEVVASKADFRLVDCVDGHIESFVHGWRVVGRLYCSRVVCWQSVLRNLHASHYQLYDAFAAFSDMLSTDHRQRQLSEVRAINVSRSSNIFILPSASKTCSTTKKQISEGRQPEVQDKYTHTRTPTHTDSHADTKKGNNKERWRSES